MKEWLSQYIWEKIPLEGELLPPASDRSFWEKLLPAKDRAEWIAEGESRLGYDWPIIPATAFLAYTRVGDRMQMENVHFARRRALSALAAAECLENKGRFVDDIVNGIFAICEETYWGLSAHFRNAKRHSDRVLPSWEDDAELDLFQAETGSELAWIWHLLGHKLSEVDPYLEQRLYYEVNRRILNNFMQHDYFWMGFGNDMLNNWNPWIVSNVISAFLLMEKNPQKRVDGIRRCACVLENFLNAYPEDGGCDEGATYWAVNGGTLYECLEQLYLASNGTINIFDQPLLKRIARFFLDQHISGQYVVNFADGSCAVEVDAPLLYRFGNAIADQELMALAAELHGTRNYLVRDMARIRPVVMGFSVYRKLDNCMLPLISSQDTCYDKIEIVNAAQSIHGGRGMYLAVKGGHNNESHNHNDVGSYIIFIDGKPLAIDAGVGVYTRETFGKHRYDIWSMQSQWHNLPVVNSCGQLSGSEHCSSAFEHCFDGDCTTVAIGLETAYDEKAGLEHLRRTVQFNRTGEWIKITDHFVFTGETNCITEHILFCKSPEIGSDRIVIPLTETNMAVVEYDPALSVAVDEMEISGDERLMKAWKQSPLYRVALSTKAGKEVTVSYSFKKNC